MIPLTFDDFSERLCALYASPLRAPTTLCKLRQVLRILAECPGLDAPSKLDTAAVVWFIESRKNAQVCTNTIIGELGYVRSICSYAIEEGLLDRSPFATRRLRLRADPPARKAWHSLSAVATVLDFLDARKGDSWESHRLYVAASTVAHTGVRRNEALYLRVEDYDASARLLLVLDGTRRRLKTHAAAAPVPVSDRLAEVLSGWLPVCGSTWLIPTADRRSPWTGGNPGTKPLDRLKAAGLRVGVTGFTWQSLRHSWATAAEGAWDLTEPQIQRVLRHTRPMTSRRYRHADAENLGRIGARIAFGRG